MAKGVEKQTASVAAIVAVFLRKSGMPREILDGSRHTHRRARRRRELMWLLRRLTKLTLAEIGMELGGLDPTTVRTGIANTSDRMAKEPLFGEWMTKTIEECVAEEASPLTDARQLAASDNPAAPPRSLAVTMICVASVLVSSQLTDAEARRAALELINRDKEVRA